MEMNMPGFIQRLRDLGRLKSVGAGMVLVGISITSTPVSAAEPTADQPGEIIFVCKYGSMKSQMAAAYFNRVAKEHGLHLTAVSRGLTPDRDIPEMIRENM